mgnify:CR=1 FL=1
MDTYNLSKVKKFLIIGMIGGILTMIGDFLLLGVDSTGAVGALGQYIMAADKLSYMRIGISGAFGYVGIPVTVFGYYVLYEIMEDKTSLIARLYRISCSLLCDLLPVLFYQSCYHDIDDRQKENLSSGLDVDSESIAFQNII